VGAVVRRSLKQETKPLWTLLCNFVAQISLTPDGRAFGTAFFSGFVHLNEQKFIEWLAT
jgi:hypothetical protein